MQIAPHSPSVWTPPRRRVDVVRAMPLGLGTGVGMRKRSAPSGSGAFTPLQLPGLIYWHDFSDASTLFTDTAGTTPALNLQQVARMNDKSGNGRFLQQATGAARPTRDTSFPTPAAFFDGGDRLIAATTFGPFSPPFTVWSLSDNTTNLSTYIDHGTGSNRILAQRGSTATSVVFGAGTFPTVTTIDVGPFRAILFVYNGAASQVWIYDSGTQAFVQQGGNVSTGTNTMNSVFYGGNVNNFLQSTQTGESGAWNAAPTAQDRANLALYFRTKWTLP